MRATLEGRNEGTEVTGRLASAVLVSENARVEVAAGVDARPDADSWSDVREEEIDDGDDEAEEAEVDAAEGRYLQLMVAKRAGS